MQENSRKNDTSIIAVNASAGSGKTFALAKRYVSLFLGGNKYPSSLRNILAVTFTRKASKEMKQRIIQFFKEISFGTDRAREILSVSAVNEETRKKARQLVDEMLSNFDFFQVETIDSFFNSLLKSCAFRLERSAVYETRTEHIEYLSRSLDLEIEKALGDPRKRELFDEFLRRLMFVENRLSWFPKEDILEVIEQLTDQASSYGKDFFPADTSSAGQVVEQKKKTFQKLKELYEHLPAKTNATFKNKLGKLFDRPGEAFQFEELSETLTKEDFPVNKGGDVPEKALKLWSDARNELEKTARKEAYSYFNYYIEIFKNVYESFENASKKDDVLFLVEFNKQAKALFSAGPGVIPEIYYRLASKYLHFLIDEFQDTSVLQWENLKPLVEESLANGGTLFYVGDKKQAIYSFRGGNAALFDQVPDELYKYAGSRMTLDENYRSQKEIVEFNNRLFSEANLTGFLSHEKFELTEQYRKEILKIFSNVTQKWQSEKKGGFVSVEPVEADADGEGAIREKLVGLVRELKERSFGYKDIAILARENAQVEEATSWLLAEGIPAESEKTLSLRENARIKELFSFLEFLNSPIDNTAFASFITGEIFAKVSGIDRRELGDFIFSSNPRITGKKENIYRAFRSQYPEAWDRLIEPFFVTVGVLTFYEFLINIFSVYGVMENFPEHHLFFISFLELAKEKSKENPGIAFFLDYFADAEPKELFVNSAKSDAVKILTIHSSKGLQFPAVIIPFFGITIRKSPAFYADTEDGLFMVPLKYARDRFSKELSALESLDIKERCIEELNTAYVALTRAEEELYVWHAPKSGGCNNLAEVFFPEDRFESGSKGIFKPSPRAGHEFEVPPRNYMNLKDFLKDEKEEPLKVSRRKEFAYGNALHFAFSLFLNLAGKNVNEEIEKAAKKTSAKFGAEALETVKKKASAIIGSGELRRFFFLDKGAVYAEKEAVSGHGQTKIIDRLIVSDNEAVIIDYKSTGENKEFHAAQVNEYKRIISEIYPDKKVKGFIIYFDTEKAVEVK